jgi:hypothetical protein
MMSALSTGPISPSRHDLSNGPISTLYLERATTRPSQVRDTTKPTRPSPEVAVLSSAWTMWTWSSSETFSSSASVGAEESSTAMVLEPWKDIGVLDESSVLVVFWASDESRSMGSAPSISEAGRLAGDEEREAEGDFSFGPFCP